MSDPFIEQPGLSRQEADYSDYVGYSVLHISKRRRNLFRNVSRHPIEDKLTKNGYTEMPLKLKKLTLSKPPWLAVHSLP